MVRTGYALQAAGIVVAILAAPMGANLAAADEGKSPCTVSPPFLDSIDAPITQVVIEAGTPVKVSSTGEAGFEVLAYFVDTDVWRTKTLSTIINCGRQAVDAVLQCLLAYPTSPLTFFECTVEALT